MQQPLFAFNCTKVYILLFALKRYSVEGTKLIKDKIKINILGTINDNELHGGPCILIKRDI